MTENWGLLSNHTFSWLQNCSIFTMAVRLFECLISFLIWTCEERWIWHWFPLRIFFVILNLILNTSNFNQKMLHVKLFSCMLTRDTNWLQIAPTISFPVELLLPVCSYPSPCLRLAPLTRRHRLVSSDAEHSRHSDELWTVIEGGLHWAFVSVSACPPSLFAAVPLKWVKRLSVA